MFILVCAQSFTLAEDWAARISDYGIYESSRVGAVDAEKVAGGLVATEDKKLIKQTDQIDAKLGTNFGFRYILSGPDEDAEVTIKVKHSTALKDPKTGEEYLISEWGQWVPVGSVNWNTGWIFEHEWEIVPGEWAIQLYIDDKKLLEKKFIVRDARKP